MTTEVKNDPQGGKQMTFTFTNHWKHEHIILLGCEWGYMGFELTILNFGFAFKIEKKYNILEFMDQ